MATFRHEVCDLGVDFNDANDEIHRFAAKRKQSNPPSWLISVEQIRAWVDEPTKIEVPPIPVSLPHQ
jgi:hypothetical protein